MEKSWGSSAAQTCFRHSRGCRQRTQPQAAPAISQIRDQVLSRLNAQLWRPSMLNVTVRHGTVDLWGFVTSDDEKKATRIAVESIPGVKAINDHLTIPPPETAMV
jgi:osmotically-inducible protein OsmY